MLSKSRIFECNNHDSNFSKKLQNFYENKFFIDIILTTKTDSMKVHAHRVILSASSDYFLAMFCSTLKEAKSDVIELGIDGPTLKLVIDFMYSGKIELRSENVANILKASDVLKMTTLKVACCDFIGESIDVTNCLSYVTMPKQSENTDIHKLAFAFVLQNFEEVRGKDEFLQLTEEQLTHLISSDDLCADSEETVFHSLVSWVERDRENREKSLTNLLGHVRFSFLKPEFIKKHRHSVCKSMESLELVCSWLESSLTSTAKPHSERKKNRKELKVEH